MAARGGVVGALAVLVLATPRAGAQRVEIGIFGGWFQQTPHTRTEFAIDGASLESERDGGGTVGAHVGVLGRRFGMTLSVLQARSTTSEMTFTDATGTVHQVFGSLEYRSTFVMLQPLVRLPVLGLEANIALGPSFTDTDGRGSVRLGEPPPDSDEEFQDVDEWWSMALSVALRAQLSPKAALEFRGNNMYRLGSDQEGNRIHWIVGVGFVWALQRE